jgi:Flp pilus assembly protein TadB
MDALVHSSWFMAMGWLLASTVVALATAVASYELLSLATFPRDRLGDSHPFERQRREQLRAGSLIYRWAEPLVDEVAAMFAAQHSTKLEALGRSLQAGREKLAWKPEEFLAAKWLEGIFFGLVLFVMFWIGGWHKTAIASGIGLPLIYGLLAPRSVRDRAARRLSRIRIRLPFAVDLIALTMEAGGGFQECLQTAVVENGEHPLTEELAEVLRQISLGRPRNEALQSLQARLHDDDINELVFAINKGEELGTPLSAILRDQAEQMRLKRSQRGEKAAGEAEVKIIFPGMVLMIACLLVIITPIVLPAVMALF